MALIFIRLSPNARQEEHAMSPRPLFPEPFPQPRREDDATPPSDDDLAGLRVSPEGAEDPTWDLGAVLDAWDARDAAAINPTDPTTEPETTTATATATRPAPIVRSRRSKAARRQANALGARGERAAERMLTALGLEILARNVVGPDGELDLVARDGNQLVFVEVKTRRNTTNVRPAAAMTTAKRLSVLRTARQYLRELGTRELLHRFDVVEVIFAGRRLLEIRLWPDEFGAIDLRRRLSRRS